MDLFPILSLILITVTIIADNAIKNRKTISLISKNLRKLDFQSLISHPTLLYYCQVFF